MTIGSDITVIPYTYLIPAILRTNHSIFDLEYVFGRRYNQLCQQLRTINSINQARHASIEVQYRGKSLNAFERFLLILYTFRSSYFHGDINPSNANAQLAASYGLKALHRLINSTP